MEQEEEGDKIKKEKKKRNEKITWTERMYVRRGEGGGN